MNAILLTNPGNGTILRRDLGRVPDRALDSAAALKLELLTLGRQHFGGENRDFRIAQQPAGMLVPLYARATNGDSIHLE